MPTMPLSIMFPGFMGSPQRMRGAVPSMNLPMGGGVQRGAQFPPAPRAQPVGGRQGGGGGLLDAFLGSRGEPNLGLMALGQGISSGDVGGAFAQFAPAIATQRQSRMTRDFLMRKGFSAEDADVIGQSPSLLNHYLKPGTEDEYAKRFAAGQQYGLTDAEDLRNYALTGKLPEGRGGEAELSIGSPQYGVDAQGNPVLLQLGKDGRAHQSVMPDGVTLSKSPIKLDAGTEWILLDPITRQPVGRVPKDLAGEAAQKEAGKLTGAAQFDLPRVEQNAAMTLDVLARMKNHPGREGSTGFIEGMLPSRTSAQVDFQSLVDQTQGQSFLQAFQMLKGAGQITEIEGAKATNAISRLGNQRLRDEDYMRAIQDLEDVIRAGLERARLQANQPTVAAPSVGSGAPAAPGGKTSTGLDWSVEP